MSRSARVERKTAETSVRVALDLDGGEVSISTGLGFFDHMLHALAKHGGFGLELSCDGDLLVDDHHTVEDTALVLGSALDQALGERRGITRFGSAYAPLDEALARAVADLSGRPFAQIDLGLRNPALGTVQSQNLAHFFQSLAMAGRLALHVDVLRGENDHHRAEAAFKATALALRQACRAEGGTEIPSTKGVL
ncbi:MAG: imidazoleglycerol-phosphate dehydratase HisB [Fimbriimonadaceae bacterium]|nr:imidazoleglycerol-phosphate dehydratase HisB [Fimbriimonadaceae bacterium]QYK59159.1 MAG: imidazoleglycerol-phosphate dehydratase HisB [Fimbriimonadaceae bacterium]